MMNYSEVLDLFIKYEQYGFNSTFTADGVVVRNGDYRIYEGDNLDYAFLAMDAFLISLED